MQRSLSKDLNTDELDSEAVEACGKRPKYGKSTVWNFFNKSKDGKTAKCIKCGRLYRTSGNTTNLSTHLMRMHPNLTISEITNDEHIPPFLNKKYEAFSTRKKSLDRALVYYISSDLQPFRAVENKGFRHLVNLLDPRYELPSRTTLQNEYMVNLFEHMKSKLKDYLDDVTYCAITADGWTSRTNENYITATCHFISDKYKLRSAVLSTRKLLDETNHTSVNISKVLHDILTEWKVFNKVTAIVTANDNMKKACEILKKRNVPCFAHSINLTVQDCLSLDNIKAMLVKCKRIVSFFKSSTIAYARFKEAQDTDNPYSLKQECPTRWNSALYMIERILLTKVAIGKVLLNTPNALSAEEIYLLEDLKQVLSPFEHATLRTSSDTIVTVSQIIPVVYGIIHNLENLKGKLKTVEGLEACNFLIEMTKQRLLPYEECNVMRVSTLLDPRFITDGFLYSSNVVEGKKFIENELSSLSGALSTADDPTPSDAGQSLFEFLEINKSHRVRSNRMDPILTLGQYYNIERLELNFNPLDYWKISPDRSLKKYIKKYFCVPATSTESERMFSKARFLLSEKRSSLKAKHVDMLLFMNRNEWISNLSSGNTTLQ